MSLQQKASGWMSTPAKGSRTRTRKKLRDQCCFSASGLAVGPPFLLDQVEVSIVIGPWRKAWSLKDGPDTRSISSCFVIITSYTLMACGLRIWRRYSELPVRETEKSLRQLSDGEAPLVPTDSPI